MPYVLDHLYAGATRTGCDGRLPPLPRQRQRGRTFATHLRAAGYRAVLVGTYLNPSPGGASALPSGAYLLRLSARSLQATQAVVLAKGGARGARLPGRGAWSNFLKSHTFNGLC
jgi:hypothetical protein